MSISRTRLQLTFHRSTTHKSIRQPKLTRAPGHGQQNLAPVPNPRHAAHHPRRQNSHPSRSRNPRRSLPPPHNTRLNRPQQPPATIQRAQRRNHRRPVQLYLQRRDPAAAEPLAPWCALVLSAQDRRPRLCRRVRCCGGCVPGESCSCWGWGYGWEYGDYKGFCGCS